LKTKCIIVDDEPIAIRVIKNHLHQFNDIEIVAECKNAIQAFEELKKKKVDLIFLDIQMPQLTGIEFVKTLLNPPKVIITTAYRDYALEGYELNIIDYLLKPISFERFLKAINKYYQQSSTNEIEIKLDENSLDNQFIYVKENKRMHKIYLQEIYYIESMKEYVAIYLNDRKIIAKNTLSNFEEKLPGNQFIRIHKSFIISIPKIRSFNSTSIEIKDINLTISRHYKEGVMKALKFKGEV
jgi:two-component system, LytTR family, response regulator